MKNSKLNRLPLLALAALPLTVGAVMAQTSTNPSGVTRVAPAQPGAQAQQPGQAQKGQQRNQSGTDYSTVFLQKLAAQLGMSTDKLKAAATAAGSATIDQGVKAGDIPAERAADMKQRLSDNPFAFGGHGGRGGPNGGHDGGGRGHGGPDGQMGGQKGGMNGGPAGQPNAQNGQNNQNGNLGGRMGRGPAGDNGGNGPRAQIGAAVAKALGLSETQLQQELQGGKTLEQLAQSKGVSTAQLHTAAVNALKTALQAEVTAGRLTQAQATQMIDRAQADAQFGLFGRH